MKALETFEHQWPYLLSYFTGVIDLEQSAQESGALERRRRVKDAATLLRLALAYGFCGLSLRATAAWAEGAEVAHLSDVALLKRLRSASKWLGQVLGAKLAAVGRLSINRELKVRLVDATCVSKPGSTGTDWRMHVSYDLAECRIDHIELTDQSGGEKLGRFTFLPQDLVLGDRGYSHLAGLAAVADANARFVVRYNWQNLPAVQADGSQWDFIAWLRTIPEAQVLETYITLQSKGRKMLVRLVALRKSEAASQQARARVIKEHKKKGTKLDPRALEVAGYVCVVTNVATDSLTGQEVLELYRFRWQIELLFKRLKGLLLLDNLPAKDPQLAQTFLYGKLLAALLLDDLTDRYLSFSPWGYPVP